MNRFLWVIGVIVLVTSCKKQETSWPGFGYDASNNKFSELSQINLQNVNQLEPVWQFEDDSENGSSVLFNPVVTGGRMYAFLPTEKLVALDAATGKLIWEFTPDSTLVSTWTRGITYHQNKEIRAGTLLFVYGSTLYSILAETGELNTSFGTAGRVDFYTGLSVKKEMEQDVHVTSNAPGVIYEDMYIVGCKVPDELPSTSGDVRAFNANSGRLEWVFHTIPEEGEYGADTWPSGARERNGGANCWGGMALDAQRGIVYVPTASPSFDFYGADREGQNLFANCLIALDARTGKRLWHFQTTHHDLWDRDNGSPPNLMTITHEGKKVDVVALATKLGYVFVFERETGKPVFPVEERPVSTASTMPGEKPWPTQPFPVKPGPFTRQGFKEEFITDLSPELNAYFKEDIRKNKYQTGIYDPPDLNGSVILPAAHGGSNWGGAAVNPHTGVMFVNAIDLPWFLRLTKTESFAAHNELEGDQLFSMYCSACHGADKKGTDFGPDIVQKSKQRSTESLVSLIRKGAEPMPSFQHLPQVQIDAIVSFLKEEKIVTALPADEKPKEPYGFSGYDFYTDAQGNFAIQPPYGTLTAIDLNRGELVWQVPLGEDKKLGIKGSGLFNRGGGIATAGGLVFIAATSDATLRGFDQLTGKTIWEKPLPGDGYGIPSTYSLNGRQYLTVGVSPNPEKGFKGGYLTFALPEK